VPHVLGQALRTWRTELDSFYDNLNNLTLFYKHIKLAIDSKVIKKHRSAFFFNREHRYFSTPQGIKKFRLLRKQRKARKKYKIRRKFNAGAIIGPRRLKLKLAYSAHPKREEKSKKYGYYSEDVNKEYIYETHDSIHKRYMTWRLSWLRRLWTSDYSLFGKRFPKRRLYIRKKKHNRRRTRLFTPMFKEEMKILKDSKEKRFLTIFKNRLQKTSFLIGNYIKTHTSISEKYENIRLNNLHPYYMSWAARKLFLINMYKKL